MDEIFDLIKEIYDISQKMSIYKGYVKNLRSSASDVYQLNVSTERKSDYFTVPIPDEYIEGYKNKLIDYYVEQIVIGTKKIQDLAKQINEL